MNHDSIQVIPYRLQTKCVIVFKIAMVSFRAAGRDGLIGTLNRNAICRKYRQGHKTKSVQFLIET